MSEPGREEPHTDSQGALCIEPVTSTLTDAGWARVKEDDISTDVFYHRFNLKVYFLPLIFIHPE